MVRKVGADDPVMVVSGNARARKAAPLLRSSQTVAVSAFASDRRASWSNPSRSNRLIDLERRARFARIESA
ncbi:hypothetical protein MJC1_02940 [Methylocystis sp. MJC1]|nr:hypothetical protein MJC1_02940 [Methylocystis sp. MJC1]